MQKFWNNPSVFHDNDLLSKVKSKEHFQFSHSVVSNSLWPHESQHTRPPCPSQTPGVYSDSCPSSQWCHPAISSSVVPFSSCPQSLPASGSFPMRQLFPWRGQSIGVSASASVLPMNSGFISFRMDWLDLLAVQGTLKSLLQHHSSKASIFRCSAFFIVQLSHPYMTTLPEQYSRWEIIPPNPIPSHLTVLLMIGKTIVKVTAQDVYTPKAWDLVIRL